jgi:hypothetical protein
MPPDSLPPIDPTGHPGLLRAVEVMEECYRRREIREQIRAARSVDTPEAN